MSFFDDLLKSAQSEFDAADPEINRAVMFEARKRKGKSPDAPMLASMTQSYRTPQALSAVLGNQPDPEFQAARKSKNIDFDVRTPGKKLGTLAGALAGDVVQDSARAFWWLVNAPQATANIIAEGTIAKARPDLYNIDRQTGRAAYGRGAKALMALPAGFAINQGIGLMNPVGGSEGYKAIVPSEEDPRKTDNVIAEVATKYFLGRSGEPFALQ